MTKILYPYLIGDTFFFDDKSKDLKAEPFVKGMSEMIWALVTVKNIPNASKGFQMTFSDQFFAGHDVELVWLRADDPDETSMPGNSYRAEIAGRVMEGWLCPALLYYFNTAPKRIFVSAEPLPEGIDPIWDDPDDRGHRIMGADDN